MVTNEGKRIIPMMTSSKRKGIFYHHPKSTTKADVRFSSILLLSHLSESYTQQQGMILGFNLTGKTLVQPH